jgi:kinesin family member 17
VKDNSLIEKIKKDYDEKMQDLVTKYNEEIESNAKLKEDMNKLKSTYEQKLTKHNNETDTTEIKTETQNKVSDNDISKVKAEAFERLQAIQEQIVGGEKVNDTELKEKRAKRKKIAEKKINAISEALSKLDDDDRLLLKAYGDITEELRARTLLVKRAKKKIQTLEQEVNDLQSEFEFDRTGKFTITHYYKIIHFLIIS